MSVESIYYTYISGEPKSSPDAFDALRNIAEWMVPTYVTRLPTTPLTVMLPLVPFALLTIMAGLSRMPSTQPLRLAFLPLAVAIHLRACFGYFFEDPNLDVVNNLLRTFGVMNPAYLTFMALSRNGILKVNEISPGVLKPESQKNGQEKDGVEPVSRPAAPEPQPVTIRSFFSNALELLGNLRGIGYQHGSGTGVYVAKETRDLSSRSAFLRESVLLIAWNYITADVANSILTWFGLREYGSTLFGHGRNQAESLAISMFLTVVTCVYFTQFVNLLQSVVSTITILLRKETGAPLEDEGWGRLIVSPWAATSLHDFWGVRWHQVIRLHMLVLGGYPLSIALRTIALHLPLPISEKSRASFAKNMGNVGLVCGTFFASAFIHYFAIAPTIDPDTGLVLNAGGTMGAPTVIYFCVQSIGIGIEKVYKRIMGRHIGGITGNMWAMCWIVGGGQFLWDSWYNRKFQPWFALPPALSVMEKYVVPFLKTIF